MQNNIDFGKGKHVAVWIVCMMMDEDGDDRIFAMFVLYMAKIQAGNACVP